VAGQIEHFGQFRTFKVTTLGNVAGSRILAEIGISCLLVGEAVTASEP
jgi:hypothetical protein